MDDRKPSFSGEETTSSQTIGIFLKPHVVHACSIFSTTRKLLLVLSAKWSKKSRLVTHTPKTRAPPGHHRDGGGGISLSARDDALPQHHPPARLELRSRREVNADRRQDADSEIDLQPGAANMGRSGHNDSGYPDQHRGGGHFHDARVGSPGGARRGSSGDRDHQMFYNEGSGHHAPAGSPHYGPHSGLFVGGGGGASSSKNLPYLAKCGGEQLRSTSGGGRKRERGLNVAASMEDDDLRDGTNGGRRGGDKNSVRNQEDSEVEDSTPRSNDESSDEEASGQNEESSDDSSEEERSPGSSRVLRFARATCAGAIDPSLHCDSILCNHKNWTIFFSSPPPCYTIDSHSNPRRKKADQNQSPVRAVRSGKRRPELVALLVNRTVASLSLIHI